ncbi:MAG: hypothetical protein WCF84_09880 [Anaerolineae bacterium]
MFDSPGFVLFVILAVLFVGSYVIGAQYNARLGDKTLKWLQKGLPQLGEKATLRWIGSSVFELKIAKARDPFRSADILVAMLPRDAPLLWGWGYMRDRRDLLIVRGQLRQAPHFDLEARVPRIWAGPNSPPNAALKWTAAQGGVANNMQADYRGRISPYSINRLIVAASLDGLTLVRLAIHGAVPNLEVYFLLPRFDQVSSQRMAASLRQLAEEVLKVE